MQWDSHWYLKIKFKCSAVYEEKKKLWNNPAQTVQKEA